MSRRTMFGVILSVFFSLPLSAASLISGLTVYDTENDPNWSVQTDLQDGDYHYGDRSFTLQSVPAEVAGLEWIRTANESTEKTVDPMAEFQVTEDARVYIAWDNRKAVQSGMG